MEHLLIISLGFLLAFTYARIIIPRILIISLRKRLFDAPDSRKVHHKPVSRLGGVSFYPVVLFVITFIIGFCDRTGFIPLTDASKYWVQILLMAAGLTLLFIVGIADDLVGVRYRQKFLVQIFAAAMLPLAGLYINDFYGLLGIHEIAPYLGVPLTMFLIVFVTNAINLIDGIDGLASGLSIVALLVFGILAVLGQRWMSALLAFVTIGVLLPFFYYNVFGNADRGRKIFMGDTGSLTLGYLLSFLAIQYCMRGEIYDHHYEGSVLISFSVLMIPCLDVVRVVIGRVRRGRDPFMPDKTHIHHKFLALGFSPRRALIFILFLSFLFSFSNVILFEYIDGNWILLGDVCVWTIMNLYISRLIRQREQLGQSTKS